MKSLINIKNKDNECFRWCHIRQLNPMERNPDRITKADKAVNHLNYDGIEFLSFLSQSSSITKSRSKTIPI